MYYITTRLNNKTICFRKEIEDPFIFSTTHISRWDIFKCLLLGKCEVSVRVDADQPVIAAVMNLNTT